MGLVGFDCSLKDYHNLWHGGYKFYTALPRALGVREMGHIKGNERRNDTIDLQYASVFSRLPRQSHKNDDYWCYTIGPWISSYIFS